MSTRPTPEDLLIAIHKHCLECSGGSRKEVQNCKIKRCSLHKYRMEPARIREKPPKGQITIFDLIKLKETQ